MDKLVRREGELEPLPASEQEALEALLERDFKERVRGLYGREHGTDVSVPDTLHDETHRRRR